MDKRSVLTRLSFVVVFTVLSYSAASAQATHRISGKVVNGSNVGIPKITIRVLDAYDKRDLGTDQTKESGIYTVTFKATATIKVFYGDNPVPISTLSGRASHQLTTVMTNVFGGSSGGDQGGTDPRNLQRANRGSRSVPLSLGNNPRD